MIRRCRRSTYFFITVLAALTGEAFAQGQDGTPAERDVDVIAVMLPGTYDNREQVYFDGRLGVREEARHSRVTSNITRVDLPAFGTHVFFVRDHRDNEPDNPDRLRIYSFEADNAAEAIRMKNYLLLGTDLIAKYKDAHLDPSLLGDRTPANTLYVEGCDVLWRREAGQFRGATEDGACRWQPEDGGEVTTVYDMMLSKDALWTLAQDYNTGGELIAGNPNGVHTKMIRARNFTCYADMPGVSGGRDIPFTRFDNLKMTDQGGMVRFTSNEDTPRTIEINLRNVDWQMNNETGAYTRDSLVMYIFERNADGSAGEFFGYTFTQPDAERLGLNLGFILVNCYVVSNRDAVPEF
jgi:hypothetical protein